MLRQAKEQAEAIIKALRNDGDPQAALNAADALLKWVNDSLAGDELVACARAQWGTDDLNIDDDAGKSEADEGVWVEAWVWLPNGEDDADA